MSYESTNGTYYTGGSGGMVLQIAGMEPVKTPAGLLATRSVETKAGWVGQIIIDKAIVWESDVHAESADAIKETNERVLARLRKLFA